VGGRLSLESSNSLAPLDVASCSPTVICVVIMNCVLNEVEKSSIYSFFLWFGLFPSCHDVSHDGIMRRCVPSWDDGLKFSSKIAHICLILTSWHRGTMQPIMLRWLNLTFLLCVLVILFSLLQISWVILNVFLLLFVRFVFFFLCFVNTLMLKLICD
jgi:hypothetical protein